MSGFTKGPWVAGAPQYARVRKCPEKQKRPITASGHPVIANVYGSANAQLVAAAPELYKALEAMVKTFDMYIQQPSAYPAYNKARAALFKAAGEGV